MAKTLVDLKSLSYVTRALIVDIVVGKVQMGDNLGGEDILG